MTMPVDEGLVADRLYAALDPYTSDDYLNDYALLVYLGGLGQMYEEINTYADDAPTGEPGWSILVDLNRTPSKALPWLGQFVGVTVDPNLADADQRQQIKDVSRQARGSVGALRGAPAPYLTGNKTVIFRERDPAACPSQPAYGLTVITYRNETPIILQVDPTGVVLTGNEITDATRLAAASWGTGQQGGQVDGAAIPGGMYIDRAATNLFGNGQCDSAASYLKQKGTETIAIDTGTAAPFSPHSISITTPGGATQEGTQAESVTGQAAAPGTTGVASIWAALAAGATYELSLGWVNADTTTTFAADTIITGQDGSRPTKIVGGVTYELLTTPSVAVAAGKTGDNLRIRLRTHTQRAETFHVAHPMGESGQPYVAPYVATSGGATATNAASRVRVAASGLMDINRGWFLIRWVAGDAAATTNNLGVFSWTDGTSQNGIYCYIHNGFIQFYRISGGASTHLSVAAAFNAGDTVNLLLSWDAANLYASYDAAAFVSTANAYIPSGLQTQWDIGDLSYSPASSEINGRVIFAACGAAGLSGQSVGFISGLPNSLVEADFPNAWELGAIFPMVDSHFNSWQGGYDPRILESLMAQKPAGIILNYRVENAQDYESLYLDYATYQDIYTTYTTYEGVLTDQPGH